jgi:hypothetical protein
MAKNRTHLDDAELEELDTIMDDHAQAREQARIAILAAQAAYHQAIIEATNRRDDRIVLVVDAGERGTSSRVAEHIGMRPANLSLRLAKARQRAAGGNEESGTRITPDAAPTSSTH